MSHERRRVVPVNVMEHPTVGWAAAPRYLPRDRDQISGDALRMQASSMAMTEVLTASD